MLAQLPPRPDVLARRETIVAGLRRLLPPDAVIDEAHLLKPYETDAMSCHRQVPLAVALPATTAERSPRSCASCTARACAWCLAAPARRCRAARCRWWTWWWSG